mmetsp:Transcript_6359/g.17210  ORF Transcript_6359/g.17210 Transcript_6359/m.17210 type:complete len:238 (-) Transcript_6359:631-1344(-)
MTRPPPSCAQRQRVTPAAVRFQGKRVVLLVSAGARRPLLRNGQRGEASPPRSSARRPQSRACDGAPTETRQAAGGRVRRSSRWPCRSRALSAAQSAHMQSRPRPAQEYSFDCSRPPRWPCGSQARTGALREPAEASAGARAPFCRKSAPTPRARGCCRSTRTSGTREGGLQIQTWAHTLTRASACDLSCRCPGQHGAVAGARSRLRAPRLHVLGADHGARHVGHLGRRPPAAVHRRA